jgi:hypothetical protein
MLSPQEDLNPISNRAVSADTQMGSIAPGMDVGISVGAFAYPVLWVAFPETLWVIDISLFFQSRFEKMPCHVGVIEELLEQDVMLMACKSIALMTVQAPPHDLMRGSRTLLDATVREVEFTLDARVRF